MSASSGEDVDDRLYRLLPMVNDWLKFAEAKNIAIVGFAGAAVGILMNFLSSDTLLSLAASLSLFIGGLALTFALVVGLASLPLQTHLERFATPRLGKPNASDDPYYVGHVAKYCPRSWAVEVMRRHIGGDIDRVQAEHVELAAQIVTNDRITLRKLRLVSLSVICFAVGVVGSSVGVYIAKIQ